jgi:steroid delta-isomerase
MSLDRSNAEASLNAYLRCWETDDRAGWLALFAANASIEDPVGVPLVRGAGIAAFWDRIHQGDMHIRCDLDRIVVCGDEALMIFTLISSGAGVSMQVQIADLFTFDDDGKITTMRAFWDARCMAMAPTNRGSEPPS